MKNKKAIKIIALCIVVLIGIYECYTLYMQDVHTILNLEGVYFLEEDGNTVVFIFDGNETVMYISDGIHSSRISYQYDGLWYNKGPFNLFMNLDDKWVKIPDAEKAGEFYAECKTSVYFSEWGEIECLNEEEIEERGIEQGVDFSKTFHFKQSGDNLTLISEDDEGYFSIPLTKTVLLEAEIWDFVNFLDMIYETELCD